VNCKSVVKELEDYLDEDLDAVLRNELEGHLSTCKKCRVFVDTTRKTIQIYCNSEPAPLPEDTRSRLHQALEKHLRRAQS
jgi:predicted anti-sigma-YlaC factor YlaD